MVAVACKPSDTGISWTPQEDRELGPALDQLGDPTGVDGCLCRLIEAVGGVSVKENLVEVVRVEDVFGVAEQSAKNTTPDVIVSRTLAQEVADCLFRQLTLRTDISVTKAHFVKLVVESYVTSYELDSCSVLFPVAL